MNILVLGSGGREHAFAHQLARSEKCSRVFVAPGNAGTATMATNVSLNVNDFNAVKELVLEEKIEMVVVGPEDPLVQGITDFFSRDPDLREVMVIGPSQKGAQLEGSKEVAKEFMLRHGIPTAAYKSFTAESLEAGKTFLEELKPPYVLKADGLAGGKGVLILQDLKEAQDELENMLRNEKFGQAGSTVVIEEFLDGIELSVFVLTDGKNYAVLPTAKDYKRIGEGDQGLNTGGMGAVSPVPFANPALMEKITDRIIIPTVEGLHRDQINYKGFLFLGLMMVDQDPYVIEYNVRMGDPETEVVLPRIEADLVETLQKTWEGRLDEVDLRVDERTAATVVLVSGGYPEAYEKGKPITGLDKIKDALVFHAGTRMENGEVLTNGGRVLVVTAFGGDYQEAINKSYQNASQVHFDKIYYRKDIGFDLF